MVEHKKSYKTWLWLQLRREHVYERSASEFHNFHTSVLITITIVSLHNILLLNRVHRAYCFKLQWKELRVENRQVNLSTFRWRNIHTRNSRDVSPAKRWERERERTGKKCTNPFPFLQLISLGVAIHHSNRGSNSGLYVGSSSPG